MPYPVILYFDVTNKCSRKLTRYLTKKGYQFSKNSWSSEESKIALKYHGHSNAAPPILQIGKMFFCGERLFDSTTMKLTPLAKKCLKECAMTVSGIEIEENRKIAVEEFLVGVRNG